MTFDEIDDRAAAQRYTNTPVYAEPLDDPDELWVHELVGTTVVDVAGIDARHVRRRDRQPGRRPARARLRCARARGLRRRARRRSAIVDRPAGGPVRPVRRLSACADRRLHDLPGRRRRRSARPACSAGPATRGLLDLRTHDLREHTTDVHRTVDDSPFGGGAGMLMRPEPVFAAVEAVDPPRPLYLLGPGGPPLRPGGAPSSWPPATGSACSAAATRASTTASAEHLVDGELSVGDVVLAGGEVAACLVVEAVTRLRARRDGQRRQPGDGELRRRRAAGGAAVHPAGRRSAAGRCPRCCAAATTAGSRAGGWPRPCTAPSRPRPDLIEARGGLSDEEQRLLEEFPALPYP